MAIQTTYSDNIRAAVAGMVANTVPAVMISRTVEDAAGIGFGVAVEQGTNDKGCIAFDGGTVLGITVRERSLDASSPDEFAQYAEARVMVKGVIWVTAAVEVAAGDAVYVRPSNGDFQDSNANSAVLLANARWETSAGIGELAQIRLA